MGDAGGTRFTAMPDEVQVKSEMIFGRDDGFHHGVGFISADAFGQKANALSDPVNMGIDWKGGTIKSKAHDNSSGFGAYAVQAGEPCFGLIHR